MPFTTVRPWFSRLLAAVLFVAALVVLRTELAGLGTAVLVAALRSVSLVGVLLALAFTLIALAALATGDGLAAREIEAGVADGAIVLAAFQGYASGLTLGAPQMAAEPVRRRLFVSLGMRPETLDELVDRSRRGLATGYLVLLGWILVWLPVGLDPVGSAPSRLFPAGGWAASVASLAGAVCLVAGGSLFVLGLGRGGDRGFARGLGFAVGRLTTALVYWSASAAALFALFPDGPALGFTTMLGAFLLAHVAGLLSRVPAGLGVFEAVLLIVLAGIVPVATALVAILTFRGVNQVAPFLASAGSLAAQEIGARRESVGAAFHALGTGVSSAVPLVLSGAVFLAGGALLFTGALPIPSGSDGTGGLPLPVIEASHFLGSVAGTVLLILAWALSRRLEVAFQATWVLLALGSVLVFLRGGSPTAAASLLLVLLLLVPARREFFRPAALTREPLSIDWLLGVVMVFATTLWLGIFAYQDVAFSDELWWQFTLRGDASRFLRASVGAAAVLLFFAGTRLLGTPEVEEVGQEDAVTPEVEAITEASPRADARLVYLEDKQILTEGDRAFIMFGVEGRSWISMGDPVGDPEAFGSLVWKFRSRTYRHGGWPVFYQATGACLPLYVDAGLSALKLGEVAVVDAQAFGLEGGKRAGMRKTVRKLEKAGATFEVLPREEVAAALPRFREISNAWLAAKGAREKSFSLGAFSEGYLARFPHAVVRYEGRIVAFGNLWLGAENHEFSLDLMRYDPEGAPDGVMQYLFAQSLLWGKDRGYRRFSLGMAPLSGLEGGPMAPLVSRLGAAVFRHGEHFYNFQGLRAYKEKFDPEWEARYLAAPPQRFALPRILASLATLVSGGPMGAFGR